MSGKINAVKTERTESKNINISNDAGFANLVAKNPGKSTSDECIPDKITGLEKRPFWWISVSGHPEFGKVKIILTTKGTYVSLDAAGNQQQLLPKTSAQDQVLPDATKACLERLKNRGFSKPFAAKYVETGRSSSVKPDKVYSANNRPVLRDHQWTYYEKNGNKVTFTADLYEKNDLVHKKYYIYDKNGKEVDLTQKLHFIGFQRDENKETAIIIQNISRLDPKQLKVKTPQQVMADNVRNAANQPTLSFSETTVTSPEDKTTSYKQAMGKALILLGAQHKKVNGEYKVVVPNTEAGGRMWAQAEAAIGQRDDISVIPEALAGSSTQFTRTLASERKTMKTQAGIEFASAVFDVLSAFAMVSNEGKTARGTKNIANLSAAEMEKIALARKTFYAKANNPASQEQNTGRITSKPMTAPKIVKNAPRNLITESTAYYGEVSKGLDEIAKSLDKGKKSADFKTDFDHVDKYLKKLESVINERSNSKKEKPSDIEYLKTVVKELKDYRKKLYNRVNNGTKPEPKKEIEYTNDTIINRILKGSSASNTPEIISTSLLSNDQITLIERIKGKEGKHIQALMQATPTDRTIDAFQKQLVQSINKLSKGSGVEISISVVRDIAGRWHFIPKIGVGNSNSVNTWNSIDVPHLTKYITEMRTYHNHPDIKKTADRSGIKNAISFSRGDIEYNETKSVFAAKIDPKIKTVDLSVAENGISFEYSKDDKGVVKIKITVPKGQTIPDAVLLGEYKDGKMDIKNGNIDNKKGYIDIRDAMKNPHSNVTVEAASGTPIDSRGSAEIAVKSELLTDKEFNVLQDEAVKETFGTRNRLLGKPYTYNDINWSKVTLEQMKTYHIHLGKLINNKIVF